MAEAAAHDRAAVGRFRPLRSLWIRLVALVIIFLAVPVPIYQQFREADQERQILLLEGAQLQGALIARALTPLLEPARTGVPPNLTSVLERLVEQDVRVKLLFRPANVPGVGGFFLVAATPAVATTVLDHERQLLIGQGVLDRLEQVCQGNSPLALRIPSEEGGQEVLTSITPINTPFGCWAIITAQSSPAYLRSAIGRPYWNTYEVRAAGVIYVGMAVLVLLFFFGVWRNLRRFGRLARKIGFGTSHTPSFAAQNTIPELHGVAQDFDWLVETLRNSAERIRRAAEDNAHAFKTPIGVIRQSVEPLRRIAGADPRAAPAIGRIEEALSRLDNLVSGARQMDQSTADLFAPPSADIDLAGLLERLLRGYAETAGDRPLRFVLDIHDRPMVRGGDDLLETALENILDNALRFSPPGGTIEVGLRRDGRFVELTVADQGPGVEPGNLDRIFERYFSEQRSDAAEHRNGGPEEPVATGASAADANEAAHAGTASRPEPAAPNGSPRNGTLRFGDITGDGEAESGEPHFGIGLWIVRQNIEALGGQVRAENRQFGGLRVRIRLPRQS